MPAVRFRIARWLRTQARLQVVVVILVSAVVLAVVLATAAGARRTSTVAERYEASRPDDFDVYIQQYEGEPMTDEFAALESLDSMAAATFVFGALIPEGGDEPLSPIVFAGDPAGVGGSLVDGRAAEGPDEVVATMGVTDLGLSIGDRFRLVTLSPEQVGPTGFTNADPEGPQRDVQLVGLFDNPADLEQFGPVVVVDRSLIASGEVAVSATLVSAQLAPGATIEDLRAEVDRLPGGTTVLIDPLEVISAELRTAIRTQAIGLWSLAGIGAFAAVIALGQLIARSTRLTPGDATSLIALGFSRRQLLMEAAARSGVVAAVAVVLALVAAVFASTIFPFGFVEPIEVSPGVRVELWTLLIGAIALFAGLIGWAVVDAGGLTRRARRERSLGGDAVVARVPVPSLSTGLHFAWTTPVGSGLRSGAAVFGLAVMVAGAAGTLTYGASVQRLVTDESRYGLEVDFFTDNGSDRVPAPLMSVLESSPDIESVTLFASTQLRRGDTVVPVAAMQRLRGALDPTITRGRLPDSPEEVALGAVTARQLDVDVGDELTLSADESAGDFRVTGIVILPTIGGNDLVGEGALITIDGLRVIFPEAVPTYAAIRLRDDAPPSAARELAEAAELGSDPNEDQRPPAILQAARTTFVPFTLAVLLAALAVIAIVGGVFAVVRRQARAMAVLRVLGASSAWLRRMLVVLGIAWAALPVLSGGVLGVIIGRMVFRRYADDLGVIDDPLLPWLVVAGAAAALVLAAIVSVSSGRRARRRTPATILRAD